MIKEYEKLIFESRYEKWLDTDIFSARWWVLVAGLILPWFLWYWLTDKKRLQEMFLYIFATSFIAVFLDEIGSILSLWSYPVDIIPFFPRLITANYTLVPIIYTLVYQYFPRWKSFIIANIVLTLVFSFVLEPILVFFKLYKLITWRHYYSIPVYFFASVILKWFLGRTYSIQEKYKNN